MKGTSPLANQFPFTNHPAEKGLATEQGFFLNYFFILDISKAGDSVT